MSDEKRIEILREIQQSHELVHIMAFDTICETAGWAADEIERLRAKNALLIETIETLTELRRGSDVGEELERLRGDDECNDRWFDPGDEAVDQ